jgi:hypothetical protein
MKETIKLEKELTEVEIAELEKKCLELAEKHNVAKVYPCVQIKNDGSNERVISFVKEPNFETKLALMDISNSLGIHQAGNNLRMMCQLTEESNPLTYGEHWECDKYKLGVAQFCLGIIEIALNEYKKK